MHYLSIDEFLGDFRQIYANARRYNPDDDEYNLPEKAIDMCDKVESLIFKFRKRNLKNVEIVISRIRERMLAPIEEPEKNDDECFVCNTEGLLICCDRCPKSYHLMCIGLTIAPDAYICNFCQKDNDSQLNLCEDGNVAEEEKDAHSISIVEKDDNLEVEEPIVWLPVGMSLNSNRQNVAFDRDLNHAIDACVIGTSDFSVESLCKLYASVSATRLHGGPGAKKKILEYLSRK